MVNKTILLTGANGFVGRALLNALLKNNYSIRILAHSTHSAQKVRMEVSNTLEVFCLTEVIKSDLWDEVLRDVDTVIHCAAQLHAIDNTETPQQQFMRSNCDTTLNLAQNAAHQGVRRFIFLSSMCVFGNMKQYAPFTEETELNPLTPYGKSKLEAEEGLKKLSGDIEIVIIRPPLVYGPGVKNNFKRLFSLVNQRVPLPLGSINNKRHFIGINNLIDFIITCILLDNAKNEVFLVADKDALSTTELIHRIGKAMNKKSILIPIPHRLLERLLKYTGLSRLSEQLFYNIEIDFHKAQSLLHWIPPYSLQEELNLSVAHFLEEKTQSNNDRFKRNT